MPIVFERESVCEREREREREKARMISRGSTRGFSFLAVRACLLDNLEEGPLACHEPRKRAFAFDGKSMHKFKRAHASAAAEPPVYSARVVAHQRS